MLESVTPPLEELGEIRGMSISNTTTAKSCVETKKNCQDQLQYQRHLKAKNKRSMSEKQIEIANNKIEQKHKKKTLAEILNKVLK